jgi:hypothetical protein
VALEALMAELPGGAAGLAEHRAGVGGAANAALAGDLGGAELQALTEAVNAMEGALRRHRLAG